MRLAWSLQGLYEFMNYPKSLGSMQLGQRQDSND
ncbi:Uncharacterised protein [Nocardia cyriacigeorgica]|uniref:Uncharacterized protein n=1 Tax=Nocardia cyriacigeorgica TaxID=135487 RepID=A0A4U8W144_9NOCA|nr:Uncharacterised protein [Nocardia cyriacigeorgica]